MPSDPTIPAQRGELKKLCRRNSVAGSSPWHQPLSQPQIAPQIQLAPLMFFCWLSDLKKGHRKEGGQCVGMLFHCFTAPSHPSHTCHQQPTLQPSSHSTETPESHWHKGWGSCTESVNFLGALLLSTVHSPPASDLEWFSSLQRIQPISPENSPWTSQRHKPNPCRGRVHTN